MKLTYEALPKLISGRLIPSQLEGELGTSSIDSRTLPSGALFWALAGEKTDGHDYIPNAFAAGARAAVVSERWFEVSGKSFPQAAFVVVQDPLKALQDLGRANRKQYSIPVIALTGSNGKTSTKELLAAALGVRYRVLKSAGNFNNHIGVPLTLLQMAPETEMVVCEMGTNHPGEIKALCDIAQPDTGLVLNVGAAHLEGLKDLESVAVEKANLLASLPAEGVAFINMDDSYVRRMGTPARKKICYGLAASQATARISDALGCWKILWAESLGSTPEGRWSFGLGEVIINLNWPGEHQLHNALTAAAVAQHFDVPLTEIARVFSSMPQIKGRMELIEKADITIIDDSYNANPTSTLAALTFLSSYPSRGRKIVVLGDHLELGAASETEHRRLGERLAQLGIRQAFLIGEEMRFAVEACRRGSVEIKYFGKDEELSKISEAIINNLKPGDIVLIKASHGMGLDRLVTFLKAHLDSSKPKS